MVVAAISAFVLLVVVVPVLVVCRDALGQMVRRRRRRRTHALPFLFIPTTTSQNRAPLSPAWLAGRSPLSAVRRPPRPEPGIADLPRSWEPDVAQVPPELPPELPPDSLFDRREEAR